MVKKLLRIGSVRSLVAVFAVVALTLSGCTKPDKERIGRVPFKVALLTPGPVSDAGWNAAAFEGLQAIKGKLGAETALVQTTSPGERTGRGTPTPGSGGDRLSD